MTFRDVAFKNFKVHVKKYLSYFLCSSFSIMLFFMYSTLLFNEKVKFEDSFDLIGFLFTLSMATVGLFAIFFINYAHTAFIKSRYKEFSLFMTLGMTQKDIQRIIAFENFVIITASLFTGLISGLIFSRLFQMIIIKLLDLKGISYLLDYRSFAVIILVFAVIFLIVIIFSNFSVRKLEISELMKKSKQGDTPSKYSLLPGFTGLALIGTALAILYFIAKDEKLNTNILCILSFIIVSFTGVYLTISNLSRTILGLGRKNKGLYYKNILTITEINHRFNQNKKIIFILSILSSMIVFFVGSPFALLKMTYNISGINQPNHIEYAEISGINSLSPKVLEDIIEKSETSLKNRSTIEFIILYYGASTDKYDASHFKPVIPQQIYNSVNKSNIAVPKGQIINVITAWEPGYHGITPGLMVKFESGTDTFVFTVKDSIHGKWITGGSAFPSSSGIVMNDEDYNELKGRVSPENIGTYHIVNFGDWQKTQETVENLKAALKSVNQQNLKADGNLIASLNVASRIDAYSSLNQGYSMFIFVTSIMGLLFFIAAGSVLYFKQYTEISNTKAKFLNLYRLGIQESEAASIISKELRLTFFTPLVLGSIMGYAFMYLVTYIVGGAEVIRDFMLSATYAVAAYFLFQTVFYLITRRKYINEVLGSLI